MLFVFAMDWVVKFLNRNSKTVALVGAFFLWLFGFINDGIIAILNSFKILLGGMHTESFGKVDFSVLQFIGEVNAITPVSEFADLLSVYITATLVIVTIRWIKSVIPSVSN